jgi:hypothetical protein
VAIYQKTGFSTAFISDSLLNFDPVVVIGSPRSATSTIARLLQEEFRIMMDEGPIRKDNHNPKGYYEDQKLVSINKIVSDNWQLGTNNENRINKDWAIKFAQWVTDRASKYEQWGFKEPRMIGFIHWIFQFLDRPLFIWPIRRDNDIIKSQVRKLGYAPIVAKKGIEAYKILIEKYIPKDQLYTIDLTIKKTDKNLIDELKGILNASS